MCAPGLSCSPSDAVFDSTGVGKVVRYCASFGDIGDKCDRIGMQCSGFLECIDGVCVDSDAPQTDVEYNGFGLSCEGRPCAPGLSCNRERSECDVPVQIVRKGGNCFDTAAAVKVRFQFLFFVLFFSIVCLCLIHFLLTRIFLC